MNRLAIGIFLVATVFRGIVGLAMSSSLEADPDAYRALAQCLAQTGVYGLVDQEGIANPTAFRPPLYPLMLSLLATRGEPTHLAVIVFHALLGGLTVMLTFLTAQRFAASLGHRAWVFAAGLVMVDPILVQQSTLLMTETLATALAALVLWWCGKANSGNGQTARQWLVWAIVLGVLLSLAFLCRPTFLVWAVLLSLFLAVASEAAWKTKCLSAFAFLCVVAVTVGGWAIRNDRALGRPIWATTHGGYTLLLANNPMFYEYLRQRSWGEVWDPDRFFVAYQNRYQGDPSDETFWQTDWSTTDLGAENQVPRVGFTTTGEPITEASDDRLVNEAAKATILRQRKMFVYSCFVRLGRLWSPMPHTVPGRMPIGNVVVGLFYGGLFLAAMFGVWKTKRRWRDPFVLACAALLLTLSVVHSVYWSNLRMRAPITPAMAVFAAIGICSLRTNQGLRQPGQLQSDSSQTLTREDL